MNLQPLYDVKERLEAAAIAGTGLLSEDFRLARAAEGLAPLASMPCWSASMPCWPPKKKNSPAAF